MNNDGIMYPITVPPRNRLRWRVIMCDGFAGGRGACELAEELGVADGDKFLRRNDLPPSLVPRGWIAWDPQFRRRRRFRRRE